MDNKENSGGQLRVNLGKCLYCGDFYRLLCVSGLCSECCGSDHFKDLPTYYIREQGTKGVHDEAKNKVFVFHNPSIRYGFDNNEIVPDI